MTATTTARVNRGHLLRAAAKGKLWLRCCYHLTDDYAWDNANDGGRQKEFSRVYLRPEERSALADEVNAAYAAGAKHADVEPLMERLRIERDARDTAIREAARGMILLDERAFRTQSGYVSGDRRSGSFAVHSNCCYDFEIRD